MIPLALLCIVYPLEIDAPLHNPHKGWVYIDHAVPGELDAGRCVPLCGDGTAYEWFQHVAVLSTWAQVEREPGVFDWSLMDRATDYWRGQGKQLHLRFSTEDFGSIPGCPRWIFAAGVPEYRREHLRYPDYTHPYYLERLGRFLEALAERYADDPGIETVNLQGYGNFGEWHSGSNYETVEDRVAALRGIIDAWRKAFGGRKFLNLSATYEWRTVANTGTPLLPHGTSIYEAFRPSYRDYVHRSGFDYAMPLPDITLSRHGVGGAVKMAYDGRFIANFFQHWRKPLFMEFFGDLKDYSGPSIVGFPATGEGDDHVESGVDELLSHHPNFATPMGWGGMGAAAAFYNDYNGLVREGHKRMGYRFVITRAAFPRRVAPGGTLMVQHRWENRALGRCFARYSLALYLVRDGVVAFTAQVDEFDPRNLVAGETYDYASAVSLPKDLAPGPYDLRLALVDGGGNPAIRLAIEGDDGDMRYSLGRVRVEEGAEAAAVPVKHAPRRDGERWVLPEALPPDRTSRVSFVYTIERDPAHDLDTDDPGYFRVYARGPEGDLRDEVRWFDKAGQPPAPKTVIITTGSEGAYQLTWGAVGGGAWTITDVRVDMLDPGSVRSVDLRGDAVRRDPRVRIVEQTRAHARKDRAEVVLPDDYCDLVSTRPDTFPLEPDAVYTVWFDWASEPALFQGDYFYLSLRDAAGVERARARWTQRHTANPVRRAYSIRTGSTPGDRLVWGMKNGGEATLLNVRIIRQ